MISYKSSVFGFDLLLRFHGSAAAKAIVPSLFSTAIYILLAYYVNWDVDESGEWRVYFHPYPMSALFGAFTFLLVFRANFSYNRYWEAATSIHQMMSKWLDCGIEMGAFHYQSTKYDKVRPPSFGKHPELHSLIRERERNNAMTYSEMSAFLDDEEDEEGSNGGNGGGMKGKFRKMLGMKKKRRGQRRRRKAQQEALKRSKKKYDISGGTQQQQPRFNHKIEERRRTTANTVTMNITATTTNNPRSNPSYDGGGHGGGDGSLSSMRSKLTSVSRLDGGMTGIMGDDDDDEPTPSLFLQELCHLLSLLNAVAFSTLRNDVENAESPLIEYIPGEPWPPVDPDDLPREHRNEFGERHKSYTAFLYLLGYTRTNKHRTMYNAARPFRVLGGISDAECQLLQRARGPYAKVALCSMWVQEFIAREYMNGSTGGVAPPIISRLFQFISDGTVGYNQARKIAYINFPFPHAQLTSLFVFIVCLAMPVLSVSWGRYVWFSALMNFLTILCFVGIHEVARELECPFQNAPNDLPLTTFQAQFNEALITVYAGFHPDAFWSVANVPATTTPPATVGGVGTNVTSMLGGGEGGGVTSSTSSSSPALLLSPNTKLVGPSSSSPSPTTSVGGGGGGALPSVSESYDEEREEESRRRLKNDNANREEGGDTAGEGEDDICTASSTPIAGTVAGGDIPSEAGLPSEITATASAAATTKKFPAMSTLTFDGQEEEGVVTTDRRDDAGAW